MHVQSSRFMEAETAAAGDLRSVNPATLHHGMKVRKGTKYVITQWYRERPWGW